MGRMNMAISWIKDTTATAFTETVVLFPLLITLLMGCFDLGQGVVINQKTIGSAQIMGDLVARHRTLNMTTVDDIIAAGRLALEPYNTASMAYDIVSLQFDDDGDPVVLWRVTENMQPNNSAVNSTVGLGNPGEGIIIVTAGYNYNPYFAKFVVDEIDMREVAFLRGRRSATVTCTNCSG